MNVSIVVPSLNGAAKIGRCITSLQSQSYQAGNIEIIVVDDGSTDSTALIARDLGVRVISLSHNQGRAAARNAGWQAAKGQLIFFTDDDCVPSQDWIERMVAQFKTDVIAVGGRITAVSTTTLCERYLTAIGYGNPALLAFGASTNPFRRFLAYVSSMFRPTSSLTSATSVQAIFTANAAYRRSVLVGLDGFDSILLTAEDADLATRAQTKYPAKHIIYEPAATVSHAHETSLWRFARQLFRRAPNTLIYYRKEAKFPPVYPLPVIFVGLVIIASLFTSLYGLLIVLLAPLILYPWWIVRAVRERSQWAFVFGFCQCLCEGAEVLGLAVGALSLLKSGKTS